MIKTILSNTNEETRIWGESLAEILKPGDIVALIGELGAGKTVLAQGILKGLGVTEPVQSPSFIMIREYKGHVPVVHIDLYRLRGSEDFEALGFVEYLDGQYVVVIEWADKIADILPMNSYIIHITWGQDHPEQRKITCRRSWKVES